MLYEEGSKHCELIDEAMVRYGKIFTFGLAAPKKRTVYASKLVNFTISITDGCDHNPSDTMDERYLISTGNDFEGNSAVFIQVFSFISRIIKNL